MSISALNTTSLSSGYGMGQMAAYGGKKPSEEDMAEFIVEKDDADGDGLLSLSETPLDEDRFNSIDADGDGFISAEELSADAKAQQQTNPLMGQLTLQMQGIDPGTMASNIIEQDDADGDGSLSLDETPLSEELFNSIDADDDGFITAEELTNDISSKQAEGMPAPPSDGGQAAAASSDSASGTSSDEEYDSYDLNKDGVVSMSELLQAFNNGDSSLSSLFGSEESEGGISSMIQSIAMKAYQAQMV